MRTIVIKLGSSIVARDDGELRADVLARICDAVAGLHRAGEECVLVSSGAIARGVRVMGLPARPTTIGELQAASAVGQGKLYRACDELLRERELTSAQVLLTAGDLAARAQYLNARHTLRTLLDWRVLAVVNENDTTATDEISFGDNDFLAAQVAMLVSADLLVLLTDIDGLHSADPRIEPDAALIEDVHGPEDLAALRIGDSTSPLGSGGMRSKVLAAEIAGAAGIPTVICNGTRAGALEAVLAGERAGTRFHPGSARHSSFKLWLRYAKPSPRHAARRRRRRARAARARHQPAARRHPRRPRRLRRRRRRRDRAGHRRRWRAGRGGRKRRRRSLAKGICNYSAAELRRVKGLKSDAVRELLPHASEEAVHRDRMVLA